MLWYQTGRLFDVSYRYPLLDLGVVTAALRLPWWAYWSQGWKRVAYRLAVEPWVPASVAWNASKIEPALSFPPEVRPVRRAATVTPWTTADERFYEAMRVVNASLWPRHSGT